MSDWYWRVIALKAAFALTFIFCNVRAEDTVQKLPYCNPTVEKDDTNLNDLVIVSTLDGRLTAFSTQNGIKAWDLETQPLLSSNLHHVEIENLLVFAQDGLCMDLNKEIGARETLWFGLDAHTGGIIYECGSGGCSTEQQTAYAGRDVIVLRRHSNTVRALDPRTGSDHGYFVYLQETCDQSVQVSDDIFDSPNISDDMSEHHDIHVHVSSLWYWWKEVLLIAVSSALLMNLMIWPRMFAPKLPPSPLPTSNEQVVVQVYNWPEKPGPSRPSIAEYSGRYENDFTSVRCLGRGGFGVVFEAKNNIDDCSYAVKRITLPRRSLSCNDSFSIVFDANAPSRAEVTNSVHSVKPSHVTSDDDSFIVFANSQEGAEGTEGGEGTGEHNSSYDRRLERVKECDYKTESSSTGKKKVKVLFSQIVSAVEYVHLAGLIHRDLKPSNILFAPDGRVKLESRPYSYKVDIYSLGLILFELLHPFSTESERVACLLQLRQHKYPPDFIADYPEETEVLKMMLSDDPSKRPTATGVRAHAPLYQQTNPDYHFVLPAMAAA
ncbi:unnamed protein product [Spodoptera littoralis]|uniref:PRKR-like endoplasmic reticulum kinase n=1 Tax=Spodoptera littoralis TaxID=7109 RepID=A0A9P0HY79_SPOLI|nr:unnamed protein product [Spodoptera littoralis]CAH1636164.1 unnamed protein product [Spodoptera littoralis]